MEQRARVARLLTAVLAASVCLSLLPALPTQARGPVKTVGREVVASIERERLVELPIVASHVALHWRGNHEAKVTVAFSADGHSFRRPMHVEHDEASRHAANGRTYGGVLWTDGAKFVRVVSDRPLGHVSVVAIDSRGQSAGAWMPTARVDAAVDAPVISSRAEWRADESLRFDPSGNEVWPMEFYPLQKLTVHHTAGENDDPDPESTVRAIYYYHAVTRGWGDIGYNFLIDESGRIYEGRYSGPLAPGEQPTGENDAGESVVGAHVTNYNSGTLGVALLGNLVTRDATRAARAALEWLLAWKAERHDIDPVGGGLYTNPVNGYQKTTPNITGHRDWAATKCPGDTFYATLPGLREAVAARVAGTTVPGAPTLTARTPFSGSGVRLNWAAPDDGGSAIIEYRVLRWKRDRFVRIAIVSGATTKYRDTNTRRGRTYRYVVRAVNSLGKGPLSNEALAVAR